MKDQIPKFFSHILTNAMKPTIVKNISPFQIGAIPNHRAKEHLFTMKSILALKEKDKEAIGIELLDLVKFFDRESLVDAMDELHKSEVRGKVYKLIFEMNKNTRITVRTPVGESTKKTAGNVSQGSVDAAIVSSNNLSKGVEDFF